jgi:3-phenylpropionate/trans-cinnamate dioxygenase ferredoxin reductase subunit
VTPRASILVVGAGQAAAQVAASLRQKGYDGSIRIVGEEPFAPYERPPLSKKFLAGETDGEALTFRPPAYWSDRDIELVTDCRIAEVEPGARRATAACGRSFTYSTMIWAAGGRARSLDCSGSQRRGIHMIRNRAEAEALRDELGTRREVLVIGGGFIGLEAASQLVTLGHRVTVVEAAPRLLARVSGNAISDFYRAEHERRGVRLITGLSAAEVLGGDRVEAVRLSDGTEIATDLVIAGIGLLPNVEPLAAAGARCGGGVEVDGFGRTSLPHIYAIGDCASQESSWAGGRRLRIESVQNAVDQAKAVAATICGEPVAYTAMPWFWSDQYDIKFQSAGLAIGHDDEILRGNPESGSFSVLYLRGRRPCAIDCVNRAQDFVQAKALLRAGLPVERRAFEDDGRTIRSLVEGEAARAAG